MNLTLHFALLILTVTFAGLCHADLNSKTASAERAKALIDDMEALYRGDISKALITMQVVTPQYQRSMEMESLNQGRDNAFIRILSPKKDRGIATLKLDQEMWNYFPKIN